MTTEAPTGPFLLCYDGSETAERAIRAASALLGGGRPARLLYVYKPVERSLGVAQAATGGRIDAPVSGETEAEERLEAGVKVARDAGFDVEPMLVSADRETATIITATAEELDSPAIVMGQRGRSALKTAILGSVSRDVVNSYHRPVILV
jgi:nucleotide-binding universal stress UspA family protein